MRALTETASTDSTEIHFVYTLQINSYLFKSTWGTEIIEKCMKSIWIIMKRDVHEAVMAYLKVLSSDLLERTGKNHETSKQSVAAVTKSIATSLGKNTDLLWAIEVAFRFLYTDGKWDWDPGTANTRAGLAKLIARREEHRAL
jgi:hypothetical protein